ncbi:probable phospholipid-transporting ATPase IM [Alosa sapidissima]|uniref:probable phospholipid-transporting ATPase IM n=1 Tax=Alosa sapidissima TaxID=34773 RepID=UPI001C08686C|nr:probable phospholipid-transporting ATPase IM [Alosa sapidissima]
MTHTEKGTWTFWPSRTKWTSCKTSHDPVTLSAEEERRVRANDREYNGKFMYAHNHIKTSKYNIFTFLPINLYEQFQRVANAYFLCLLILQLIPQISSLSWFTTCVPLALVLLVTAVKDATDDYFRHRSDRQVNTRQSQVLIEGKLQREKWMNVHVGDIIKLENNQFIAADLLLLSSSEPNGLCYIETAELDGETNLKVRQALPITSELGANITQLAEFDGEVVCEAPNNRLDRFTGTLTWKDSKYSLENQRLLLRGCMLRNTDWCFGMVIFAGLQTKLMQNCGKTKLKRTSIDRLLNTLVLWIFGLLLCLGFTLSIGSSIWEYNVGKHFQIYLQWEPNMDSAVFYGFLTFWSYIIILNTVVPISLYVSMEIIRLMQSYFISWDMGMYHSGQDMPAEARTTTLTEQLGQVEYVFSDKTGTLTQNIMTFNKCSINGTVYGEVYDDYGHKVEITESTPCVDFSFNPLEDAHFRFHDATLVKAVQDGDMPVQEFFRLLALCHTVMPEEKVEGELVYQAQSPDEGALVTAARNFGFVFRGRTPETITVVEMGKSVDYQLLAILDFNNVRKRMSVIVKTPDGQIKLYCKGADTILFERLNPSNEDLKRITSEHLNMFAGEGLRTLVLAYKDLDRTSFKEWTKRLHTASTALEDREQLVDALCEEIERDLILLGATAIEDKLQEGVAETLVALSLANIKIWILTGDKLETAMNVAYSCNMLRDDMSEVFIISGPTAVEVQKQLRNAKDHIGGPLTHKNDIHTDDCVFEETMNAEYALIISGPCLAYALEAEMQHLLLDTACLCKTVICCRVTPLQKAQVVELVKKQKQAVTLAIGDGANDVSMIKTAHIGVGISGEEGRQAVLVSDYSFAQFCFLQRLLLVHGRWSYHRMCKFLRYFFYKNFAFTLVHFWFAFFCGFSAQTIYDQWFITLFNVIYTSQPVLALGLFDQDVSEQNSLRYPKLYEPGQQRQLFNKRQFLLCSLNGIGTSLALFFVPYCALGHSLKEDGTTVTDHQSFAVVISTSLIIVVSIQIGLDTNYWTPINHVCIWGSVAMYFFIVFAPHRSSTFDELPKYFPFFGTAHNCLTCRTVWLVILLTTVTCIMPGVVFRFVQRELCPTLIEKVRHLQVSKKQNPLKQSHRLARRASRRSAYAFSHQEGFGELITSGRNMRGSMAPPQGKLQSSTSWVDSMLKRIAEQGMRIGSSSPKSMASPRNIALRVRDTIRPQREHIAMDENVTDTMLPVV